MEKLFQKTPWGAIAWGLGILVFYLTAGIIAAYFVLSQVAAQTSQVITLFSNWWQTLMFVADVLFAAGTVACIVFYARKKCLSAKAQGGKA